MANTQLAAAMPGDGNSRAVPANSFVTRFETLARRGALESAAVGTTDLLVAWLEAIRKEHINFRSDQIATEMNGDGREGAQYVLGSIDRVCEASAILCRKLEAGAIQAEFEEKQRNDPQNWSPFRREYEAFKSIKQLRSEPPEQIPEWFVRNALARIYDIKPEEVTAKQINFEVAGLVPFYRSIQLIADNPAQGAPDATPSEQLTIDQLPKPIPQSPPDETIADQLQRLRDECRWTIEELADAADISTRTVARHLSGAAIPYPRNISACERVFGKQLKRHIVISKMSKMS